MTKSEWAVEELRLALGPVDFQRATNAVRALEETNTIPPIVAERLATALGTVRDTMRSFNKIA
jgi:hypothetical protein